MRRTLVRGTVLAAIAGAAVLAVTASVAAQPSGGITETSQRTAVGTWNQTVHTPGGDEPTMVSFHGDGTLSAIAPTLTLPCGGGTCTLASPSVGRWRMTGTNTFEYTITEYVYDANGVLVEYIIPHDIATISADGSSYHATGTTGVWTADHQLLATVSASADASRLQFPRY